MTATETRLLVVSMGDPRTRDSWSGTPFYALKELRERFEDLEIVATPRFDQLIDLFGRLASFFGVDIRFEPWVRRIYSRLVDQRIQRFRPHVLISIGATYKVCDIKSSVPIIHVSDALFCTITGYYRNYVGLRVKTQSDA